MGAGRGTVLPGGVQVVRLGDDRLHNAGWASYILRFLFGRLLESRPYRVMRALGLECRSLAHRIQSQHKKPCWVLPLDAGCDPLSSPEEERQRRIRSQGRIDCIEAQCASRPWMTLSDLEIFVLGWNEAERWLCGNPGILPYRQDKRQPCNSNPNQSRRDYTPATPSNSVMSQTHKSSKKFATPSPELPYGEVNCLECGRCMYIGQLIPHGVRIYVQEVRGGECISRVHSTSSCRKASRPGRFFLESAVTARHAETAAPQAPRWDGRSSSSRLAEAGGVVAHAARHERDNNEPGREC